MLTFQGPRESFQIEADPQLNLLAHAQLDEWFLGSRCGGHGECGRDRVRVNPQAGDLSAVTGAELKLLTPEELAQGWRLACQCWPERRGLNLRLECPVLSRGSGGKPGS